MPSERLRRLLDQSGARYEVVKHLSAYTSQRTAEAAHVRGQELAKTVVLRVDGAYALAVLPAPDHVDVERFKQVAGAGEVALAREDEFARLFPDCELGAEPPFGSLYGLPVWVEEHLTRDPSIVFNAGTHTEALRMDYAEWARVANPRVARFARGH